MRVRVPRNRCDRMSSANFASSRRSLSVIKNGVPIIWGAGPFAKGGERRDYVANFNVRVLVGSEFDSYDQCSAVKRPSSFLSLDPGAAE